MMLTFHFQLNPKSGNDTTKYFLSNHLANFYGISRLQPFFIITHEQLTELREINMYIGITEKLSLVMYGLRWTRIIFQKRR